MLGVQVPSRPRGAAWESVENSIAWCGSHVFSGIWAQPWPRCWMGWSALWPRKHSSTLCSQVGVWSCGKHWVSSASGFGNKIILLVVKLFFSSDLNMWDRSAIQLNLLLIKLIPLTSSQCPGIVAALTWPASLLAAASVIDNPWCVCLNRSAEVGKHLAQVLRSRQQVLYLLLAPFRHAFPKGTAVSCQLFFRPLFILCTH